MRHETDPDKDHDPNDALYARMIAQIIERDNPSELPAKARRMISGLLKSFADKVDVIDHAVSGYQIRVDVSGAATPERLAAIFARMATEAHVTSREAVSAPEGAPYKTYALRFSPDTNIPMSLERIESIPDVKKVYVERQTVKPSAL